MIFMMADNKEQRVCVKFCFLLGKSAVESVLMLQEALKEEALSKIKVYEWYSRFKGGEMSCEEQPRSGLLSTYRNGENCRSRRRSLNVEKQLLFEDRTQCCCIKVYITKFHLNWLTQYNVCFF